MSDSHKPADGVSPDDELQSALTQTGASAPSVDRLGRVARDMQEIEWKMLRRAAAAAGGPPSSSNGPSKL